MNFLKNKQNRNITIVCLLIAFLCIYFINNDELFRNKHQLQLSSIGKFEDLKKDVRKKNIASYFWDNLKPKDSLSEGDSIFTGSDSSVTIKLSSGQIITVAPNSLIKFSAKNKKIVLDIPYGGVQLDNVVEDIVISDCGHAVNLAHGDDSVALKKSEKCGSISAISKSASVVSSFKLKKVKKDFTDTFAELADSGVIDKLERTIASVSASGANQSETINSILPPHFENLEINYLATSKNPVLIKWAPVTNAKSYEIEISDIYDFSTFEKFSTSETQLGLKKLTSSLFYRGRAFADNNVVSLYSDIGKLNTQFPEIKMKNKKLVKNYNAKNPKDLGEKETFDISWSKVPFSDHYVVELKDENNVSKTLKFNSRMPANIIEVPTTGKYKYQVHAVDSKGRKISSSGYGEVLYNKVFSILAPLIKEELNDKFYFFQKSAAKYIWLNWLPQGQEEKFRVEISRDKDFSNIIKSAFTTKSKLLVTDQVQAGDYFWRVRSEDKDHYSDWSNTELFRVKISNSN